MTVVGEAPAISAGQRVQAFARLGKVKLFEIWLGPVLAWSLVIGAGLVDVKSGVLCALFFGALATGMWATHAFDDITGFKDGSDVRTYAPERKRSQVKPLVHGHLSVKQAQVFAYTTAAVAIGCVVAFCAVTAFRPWWLFVGGLAVIVFGAQYSAGINFSYRFIAGGETLTGVTLAASVILPYAAALQRVDWVAVVQGVLFGTWLVQVLICSNSADAEDDRQVGRRTVAARTSVQGNKIFVASVFGFTWALAIVAVATGVMTFWAIPALLPAWALQAYVLRNGMRGQWRNRRNYGFQALRLAIAGLVIVNVLT
ncbi:1,4-dihydroxy-2-naphthoate octaprenyltransferase [Amycolatopsis xylanica]|uniref:1,4-dihydroxy-2-naphthoate octaprenyltransferase n=1 Tax=Amycolatopsis xylanica TaxID=589385 RepID=A0A1H3PGW3_9PSEU|nr:UbiA family prenyltransferase [Amycolatopsis xylanica]SDZ00218.1 1,4-dihydroxy-2-naphthoate octaprenyltransferase [Amycolatopsis xylanica]